MNSTQYTKSSSSKNLFRERSITGIPRQSSVMAIINERQSNMASQLRRKEEEKSTILTKDNEISKLRRNLETAMSTAIYSKLENSKSKEEVIESNHLKNYLQNKIKQYEREIRTERQQHAIVVIRNEQLNSKVEATTAKCRQIEQQLQKANSELIILRRLTQQIEKYKILLKDIEPLKERIITLQDQVRQQKLLRKEAQKQLKQREKEIQALQKQVADSKPKQQELRQKIAYFQRVNLDLERKMEDYNRRQNDYIKQITLLRLSLTKTTAERNHFKTVYEETEQKLAIKCKQYDILSEQLSQKLIEIEQLKESLQIEQRTTKQLKSDIEGKVVYYKKQGEQNIILKQKNDLLRKQEFELRKVIESYVRIAEEVNLTIVRKIEEIKKLKIVIESLRAQLDINSEKFEKFDKLLEQGSQKGFNQIREGFFSVMRNNNELSVTIKEMKASFEQKFLIYGEQRDILCRDIAIRKIQPPTDQTQYLSIFDQKTEALLLFQTSNDQLLKIKRDLQNKIEELHEEIEKGKKELTILKIKTADLFKVKKELDEAKKTAQRYQEMIEQERQAIEDLKSQVSALRQRNNDLSNKHFVVELEKKNLEVKVKQMDEIMKELNVEHLMIHKNTNEKNKHLLADSLQKLQSAIKSLAFFFSCAFCGQMPTSPVTLALCGHNYCSKCKQAYAQSCYECDTGQPIEKVFQNKFLKDAGGKYKFLTMVVSQLRANYSKKQ